MIKFALLILFAYTPVQALQILQSEHGNEIIKHQPKIVEESSELSADLLLTKLEKSAKSGNIRSQFSLANMYHNGIGVKTNEKLAFYWYSRVADQGFASAQFNIANGYYYGIGTAINLNKALLWYQKAAEQGFVLAQYNLAVMYRQGEGTEVDNKAAFRWYQKAAQSGHHIAQVALGTLYLHGIGVAKDEDKAKALLLSAAQAGYDQAQFQLGKLFLAQDNKTLARKWLLKASDQSFELATALLSELDNAESLDKVVPIPIPTLAPVLKIASTPTLVLKIAPTPPPSVKLTKHQKNEINVSTTQLTDEIASGLEAQFIQQPATSMPNQQQIVASLNRNTKRMNQVEKLMMDAQQGEPMAQYQLSILYGRGEWVAKNEKKAFLLMQQSANQEMANAQAALAMMYANGIGVEADYQAAYYWASVSARNGNTQGQAILLYLLGNVP